VAAPALKKRLGQHHLVQPALCAPAVEFLRPAGERVVEIGPGGGVLTRELLAAGAARVTGWEIDLEWAFALRRRLSDARLQVVAGDALELQWDRLRAPALVTGNLPYGIATALLERLLPHHRRVRRAAFLVQLEVAERLLAGPGDPDYGALSVLVAAWSTPRHLARVGRGSFRPPPRVDGAFVGFEPHPPPLPEALMPAFAAFVRAAFSQRRKTLRNSLAATAGRERATAALAELGLRPDARAEQLDLEGFLSLYAILDAGLDAKS
jgi:16S rRNA (adenine1518-N6/adenine1519-N6)-dimethyltransferase